MNRTSGRQPDSQHHDGLTLNEAMRETGRTTWPAPTTGDAFDRAGPRPSAEEKNSAYLNEVMIGASDVWPTVQASTASSGSSSRSGDRKDELLLLGMMRENAAWSTPLAADVRGRTEAFDQGGTPLSAQMQSAWAAPRARDHAGPNPADLDQEGSSPLNDQMYQTWAAPRAGDWRSGSSQVGSAELRPGGAMLPEQMSQTEVGGPSTVGSNATTAKRAGSPNPLFPCWLQGYPAEWLLGAVWAMRSTRSSPPKSSRRSASTSKKRAAGD